MHTITLVLSGALMLNVCTTAASFAQSAPAFNGQTLINANFAGQQLRGASFNGANLRNADLSGAQLQSVSMSGTDLTSANLVGADLTNAMLSGANLRDADLRKATLDGADLTGADLKSTHLEGVDLGQVLGLMPDQLAEALTDAGTQSPSPQQAPAASLAAAEPVPVPTSVPLGLLPAGFPVPPGTGLVASDGDTGAMNVVLAVPDAGGASMFWRNTLPSAGYTITNPTRSGAGSLGDYTITFNGNGYRQGRIVIATLFGPATTVAITLQR